MPPNNPMPRCGARQRALGDDDAPHATEKIQQHHSMSSVVERCVVHERRVGGIVGNTRARAPPAMGPHGSRRGWTTVSAMTRWSLGHCATAHVAAVRPEGMRGSVWRLG